MMPRSLIMDALKAYAPDARGILTCTLAAALALPGAAFATDYSLGGTLRVDAYHDDNIRLLEENGPSAFGQTIAPTIKAAATSERFEASLDTQLRFLRFNRSELDSDDQTLQGNLLWRAERSESRLMARWIRDSTLTSEQLDSGRVGDASRRETYLIQPSWTYYLTERNLLTVSGFYNDSDYRDDAFVDYQYLQASLRWTHILSERVHFLMQALYSEYQSADRDFPTFRQSYSQQNNDTGLQIGGQYRWSENLTATALIGQSRSKQRYDVDDPIGYCRSFLAPFAPLCQLEDSENDLSTLDASLNWNTERNQLTVNATRSTQPSSDGQVLEATQLHTNWVYRFWEHGDLVVNLTVGRHTAAGGDQSVSARSERDFGYASLGYRHQLSETWSLSTTYQYRYQDYEVRPTSAESHRLSLGITYQPRERHWSR